MFLDHKENLSSILECYWKKKVSIRIALTQTQNDLNAYIVIILLVPAKKETIYCIIKSTAVKLNYLHDRYSVRYNI